MPLHEVIVLDDDDDGGGGVGGGEVGSVLSSSPSSPAAPFVSGRQARTTTRRRSMDGTDTYRRGMLIHTAPPTRPRGVPAKRGWPHRSNPPLAAGGSGGVVVKEEDLSIDWEMASSQEGEESSVAYSMVRGGSRKGSRSPGEVRGGGCRGSGHSVSDDVGNGDEEEGDSEEQEEEDGEDDQEEDAAEDEEVDGEEEEKEEKEEEEWEQEEEEAEEEVEEEEEEEEAVGMDEYGDESGEESRPPRNATAARRNAGAKINTTAEIFARRLFEGWCIARNADTTDAGKPVSARTRSRRGCLDMKLLREATCSKPYCVDTPSGSSSEDTPPPLPPVRQPQRILPSSSCEEDSGGGSDRRTGIRRRRHREQNSDDDFKDDGGGDQGTAARRRRQREQNAPHTDDDFKKGNGDHGMAARRRRQREQNAHGDGEDDDDDDSEEDRPFVVSRRLKRGAASRIPTDGCNQQGLGDVSFKKNSLFAPMAARCAGVRETYDDLIDSIFEGVERYPRDASSPGPGEEEYSWSGSKVELPLIFSFGDEDEVVEEKTEQSKFEDQLWAALDFAFESLNVCSHTCEEGETRQEVPADKTTSCNRGKHDLIIDEQIGVRCKHCDFVDIEIRDVFPSMVKHPMEREPTIDCNLDLIFDDILKSMGYEDASNFGGHKTGLVWDLIPGVREDMFPHQKEGFEFMWKKLAGGIDIEQLKHTVNNDTTSGCVISHAPGTGKTRLAITFVQSYLELFPLCRPVIIAPRGMLATWEQEFRKWDVKLPFHVLSSSEIKWNEDKTIQKLIAQDKSLGLKLCMNKLTQKSKLTVKLASWYQGSSIIGLSYSLYRRLANDESVDGHTVRKLLLENPDLLVLDEGHTPRNKKSKIWKVLAEVSTEKRIILSGTPFQNNFLELYNILCLVKPTFARDFACTRLDKKGLASKRTSQSRETPHLEEDEEGKEFWTSLRISSITDENVSEIREKLDPFVHIHNGDILQKSLPGLIESVVILNPLPHQKEIITMMEKSAGKGFLDSEYKISLASIHPFLVTSTKLSDEEASVVDKLKSSRLNPCEGVKTRFVLEIVRLCETLEERVLVFSQYLEPLSLIMDQLTSKFTWTEGKEILLMSGNVRVKQREALMEAFNDMNSEAKVMLASTKACCEGITLVGASRVVLLDVVWNPSVGRQAIGRAYRIGQEKIVYTYNLIAEGTKEKVKYDRQAKKDHMSKLLFSNEPQPAGCNLSSELIVNDRILEELTAHRELKDMFVQILPSH